MHCVDCHFVQDVHGNTRLYSEVRAAIEIQCIDCHGTADKRADLLTSGPAVVHLAAAGQGRPRPRGPAHPFGQAPVRAPGRARSSRTRWSSPTWPGRSSRPPTRSTPNQPHYNEKSHLAKTVRFDADGQIVWGDLPGGSEKACAHANENMSCIACHSSWNPSCFGCHLPQKANKKMPSLHNEGDVTRNYVSYNFQTLRDDVFMLARDGDVTGNRIGPARSSCAIHVGSYNANRESIYVQQQTISAEGQSGDRLQHQRAAHRARRAAGPHDRRAGQRPADSPRGLPAGPQRDQAVHRLPPRRRAMTTTRSWPSS